MNFNIDLEVEKLYIKLVVKLFNEIREDDLPEFLNYLDREKFRLLKELINDQST